MVFFNKKDKLQIIAFQSYGTDTHIYARGRALEDEQIGLAEKGILKLIINTWKRFGTDEVRNTGLTLKLPDGRTVTGTTDNDGYYLLEEPSANLEALTNEEGWLPYEISYNDASLKREILHQNRFPGEVLIPSKKAAYGVISDIDDTIIHTGVASFLKNAGSRSPLKGAANFYHLLHRGKTGKGVNPIFYVSHSPWNLYRYLEFFLKENNFPKGPILLRSFSTIFQRKKESEKPQKQKEIINILKTYPQLPFILIGDSGEHDADIYIEIAQAHPDRILAIYLRSVTHRKKMTRIRGLFEEYRTTPVLLVENSEKAIEHARENGFI